MTIEENIANRRSFKIVSVITPSKSGVTTLAELYDRIRNGSILVEWL